jgi:hypothetical protein
MVQLINLSGSLVEEGVVKSENKTPYSRILSP